MQTLQTKQDIINYVNENNYYYGGKHYESLKQFEAESFNHFEDIIEEVGDNYEIGSFVELVEKFYCIETGEVVNIQYHKAYINAPSFGNVDYFYGFILN